MGKLFADSVLDAACAKVATGTHVTVCSSAPANYAGISAVTLATVTVTAGNGNGDWTIADGDTSGRKVTLTAQSDVDVTDDYTSGSDTLHLAVDDGSTLLALTTITDQTLVSGAKVDIPATDFEFRDPT